MPDVKTFKELAEVFEKLEAVSASTEMIDILAGYFSEIRPKDARRTAYLLGGKIAPDYVGPKFGLAESLVTDALARASDKDAEEIETMYAETGDLGDVAANLATRKRSSGRTLKDVFRRLADIAHASGEGSQEEKLSLLADILENSVAVEAKYVVRIVLGELRLGVGDMTFLYGLSAALTGSKDKKDVLEHAYNVFSDLGKVAYEAVKNGIDSLEDASPIVGIPVRMMLAQRVDAFRDVSEHIPGEAVVEYKYDGERVQAHLKADGTIALFSRRHERITHQFPDVVAALRDAFQGEEGIVEGEVVAVDPGTGALQDFQKLMTRRRKHDVEAYAERVPVRLFLFDILALEGESFLDAPLMERKKQLTRVVSENEGAECAESITTDDHDEMEAHFTRAVQWGAEGVIIKNAASPYQAGTRGWNWIKYKKEYEEELADSFDVVVVGGFYGTGKRAGTYGSLLVAAYDPEENRYYSFTKVGTGFSDEELEKLPNRFERLARKRKHRLVDADVEADVWFAPEHVMEITGAELTVSPVHTVAKEEGEGGLALRFPRFVRWRDDKSAEDATTVAEIEEMSKE